MDSTVQEGDRLFLIAETLARESDLFPTVTPGTEYSVDGLLSEEQVRLRAEELQRADIDSYIEAVVSRAELPNRIAAPEVIRMLGRVREERSDGAYYEAYLDMDFGDTSRLIGFVAQDRSVRNGEWMPEHHLAAAQFVAECSKRSTPIVSLMDTPGAAGDEIANRNNQAHRISRLITEMSNVGVPNVGIVFGLGYSGGAIPLAASNIILSVRDGVFSTIQPRSLASIARRMNLSWQECAKHVGLSPYELMQQGNIDGVIDYTPGEVGEKLENFRLAIVSSIKAVEETTRTFVASNPYILEHYSRNLRRFLEPSQRLQQMEASAALLGTVYPTEFINVFGVAFRYLRYLRVRRRIRATSKQQYGRLSQVEVPEGELLRRNNLERRRTFLRWMQDPDRLLYDEVLKWAWKNYEEKRAAVGVQRGRLSQMLLGEPRKNFEDARSALRNSVAMYLYNIWKTDASGNLQTLIECLRHPDDTESLLMPNDIVDPQGLLDELRVNRTIGPSLRDRFTQEGKKLLNREGSAANVTATQLCVELNLALTEGDLRRSADESADPESADSDSGTTLRIRQNREILDECFGTYFKPKSTDADGVELVDMTIVDVLFHDELREEFVEELQNLLLFDHVYDHLVASLQSIAEEAERTQSLQRESVKSFLGAAVDAALKELGDVIGVEAEDTAQEKDQFLTWLLQLTEQPRTGRFLHTVEEWKKTSVPEVSDTLIVVVTFVIEKLVPAYLKAERSGARYNGKIAPRNIGRKKDFWHRLEIAYRDLRILQTLDRFKRQRKSGFESFRETFFDDFEELFGDLLSSDPCDFPGFRMSIETALKNESPPCGVVTGIGTFKDGRGGFRAGTVISNAGFQAGAFDMASAEKFCRLMVTCARLRIPIICFISSGGMQTKEGAGALFSMAAINDRITRFVRDHDLPIIVFGYGDCTGGAQASFVTHPLVQTYYFSGASMPFAGQIVIPSHLPAESIIANYLSQVPGSMQGLVEHPFHPDQDEELRAVDPNIPLPNSTVVDVVNRVMSGIFSDDRPTTRQPQTDLQRDEDLYRPVRRVLVHARGCAASKLVRIAREQSIEIVLIQSDPDIESVAVDMLGPLDTVVCIGGNTPDESYLNARSVLTVAQNEHVDSLHPGIGFLSESSQFAELARSQGINFIGPPVAAMETMGNKSNAINTALRLGVPVVPGSHGIVTDVDLAASVAEKIGYPVLIKAVHGGGGKGIQVVESAVEFHERFHRVSTEARAAFGNGDVYLEKYVTALRHIEAQILRDSQGNTMVLGIRDCSVQRNNQKVIEESGSTLLSEELHASVLSHAASIAEEVDYVGAGTVEFIFDLKSNAVYFMEMNTRLQVEHPVTELVSGVDIVAQQFRIAGGETIDELKLDSNGYAIEARVNAERVTLNADGELDFQPSAGWISECVLPDEPGIDVITSAGEGKLVSPYYDSMIAQVIAHGTDRNDTARRLEEYLSRCRIRGIYTNIGLLRRILTDEQFLDGDYDTTYLPKLLARVDVAALAKEIDEAAGIDGSALGIDAIRIDDSDELKVLAPASSIYYSRPTPTEADYVSVGDTVDSETTLCQLEAFKIFSPLRLRDFNTTDEPLYPSDQQYEIRRINVATGQQVNSGDLLFVVAPLT